MVKTVRIGGASAAWGDTGEGMRQLVDAGSVDYIVGDYLAEVTMSILARMHAKSDEMGYIPDWLAAVRPVLGKIAGQGIKLVTNSGGINPLRCRDAFCAMAAEEGVDLKVATITGDNLLVIEEEIRESGLPEMFTEAGMPEKFESVNAYLGAIAIARALKEGADVVITGRVVDSALALGPLMYEFDWAPDDFDQLAQGSLAGHVIECGVQATGGISTDWELVSDGWANMGFPIIECVADGSFTVTKPAGTGGRIVPHTVAEQIVYEIGNPAEYRLPDVICDFRGVQLESEGQDRVIVRGATGRAPASHYKVCGVWHDGFRLISTYLVAGGSAAARGRRMAEALIDRTGRLIAEKGMTPYSETSIELIGAGDSYGPCRRDDQAREVLVKIGLRHADKKALEVFAKEFATPAVSTAQGVSGIFAGRPKPVPVFRVHSFMWPKKKVGVQVHIGERVIDVDMPVFETAPDPTPMPTPSADIAKPSDPMVPLRSIAIGRSGDKGDDANIGIIARQPEFLPRILAEVTEGAVADWFAHYLEGSVTRYVIPGFSGVNFLLTKVLNGGGSSSLRFDPQAKTFAQLLLDMPVRVPARWLETGGALAQATLAQEAEGK